MAEAPSSREPGRPRKDVRRALLWSLAGLLLLLVVVVSTLPILEAERTSLILPVVIVGILFLLVLFALAVLPIFTRRR